MTRRTPRHDQDFRAGSNRSAAQRVRSATAIAVPLVGHVCPLSERVRELPRNPFGGRMSRSAEPQDLPPVMSQN